VVDYTLMTRPIASPSNTATLCQAVHNIIQTYRRGTQLDGRRPPMATDRPAGQKSL